MPDIAQKLSNQVAQAKDYDHRPSWQQTEHGMPSEEAMISRFQLFEEGLLNEESEPDTTSLPHNQQQTQPSQ
jgi:hypothetical protein